MYYVLFNYTKKTGKGWLPFSLESLVIKFLHKSYEDIEVVQIIEVKAEYHLGLIVTEEYIKSTLVIEEEKEPESLVPVDEGRDKQILKRNKKTLEELEAGEPSAMEKIGDDIEKEIEEEVTPEQKTKAIMDDADNIIEREKKRAEQKEKGWELCIKCNSNRVAPWNKKKICSPCQGERKTTRPYSRSKEFAGL